MGSPIHLLKHIAQHPVGTIADSPLIWRCYRKNPLEIRMPWITASAFRRLSSLIPPEARIFEWGSGGSTLYFLDRGASISSVEHDQEWATKLISKLTPQEKPRLRYHVREPAHLGLDQKPKFPSGRKEWQGFDFTDYVGTIEAYPEYAFDLIVIDGRARVACASIAARYLQPGGIIIFDNSNRQRYHPGFQPFRDWRRETYPGLTLFSLEISETTLFFKPK